MTSEQYDNLVDICSRVEQLRSLIVLYTDTFSSSTDVERLVLAIKSRPEEYTVLATLIFDLVHECWTRFDTAINDLPPPVKYNA